MYVRMYVCCMYVRTHITYMHLHLYRYRMYIFIHIYMYTQYCLCICTYNMHMLTCLYIYVPVCMYVCMYVCRYVCGCLFTRIGHASILHLYPLGCCAPAVCCRMSSAAMGSASCALLTSSCRCRRSPVPLSEGIYPIKLHSIKLSKP